jgi:hypothetical protein
MSEFIPYDPDLLTIERAEVIPATVGSFIVGYSKLGGGDSSGYAPIPFTSFSYTANYNPNDDRVLIVDIISGTITYEYWGDTVNSEETLRISDKVRVKYGTYWTWDAVVETVTSNTYFDQVARTHGDYQRTVMSISLLDANFAAMRKEVCWTYLPAGTALQRIRAFGVKVNGF